MTYDAKELEQYPEIMNKEQLRKACHISKRTAHYLLKFNLIPTSAPGRKLAATPSRNATSSTL